MLWSFSRYPCKAFISPVIVGLGVRSWFSVQRVLQLLLLLFPLRQPPLDLLFQLRVWSDLVHSEGAPIERICLVAERQSIERIIWMAPALEIRRKKKKRGREAGKRGTIFQLLSEVDAPRPGMVG